MRTMCMEAEIARPLCVYALEEDNIQLMGLSHTYQAGTAFCSGFTDSSVCATILVFHFRLFSNFYTAFLKVILVVLLEDDVFDVGGGVDILDLPSPELANLPQIVKVCNSLTPTMSV